MGYVPADVLQTGEYATDEDEEAGRALTGGEMTIEVFDLPETEDMYSPSEVDATKLSQKFREVGMTHVRGIYQRRAFERHPHCLMCILSSVR